MNEEQKENSIRALYRNILLGKSPIEVETVRLNGANGLWFSASREGGSMVISNATVHKPSVQLEMPRYIQEEEFVRTGKQYEDWKTGQAARAEIRNQSQNTSYIFGLIAYFETLEEKRNV